MPQLPAFLCPVLDFALCLKQECPAAAASHSPCWYREGGDAGEGEQGGSETLAAAKKGKPCSQWLCLCFEIMPICCSFTCLPEC